MADKDSGDSVAPPTNENLVTVLRELAKRGIYKGPADSPLEGDAKYALDKLLNEAQASDYYDGPYDGLPGPAVRRVLRKQGADPKFVKALKALHEDGTFAVAYLDGAAEKPKEAVAMKVEWKGGELKIDGKALEKPEEFFKMLAADPDRMVDVSTDSPGAPAGRMTAREYVRKAEDAFDAKMKKDDTFRKNMGEAARLTGYTISETDMRSAEKKFILAGHAYLEGRTEDAKALSEAMAGDLGSSVKKTPDASKFHAPSPEPARISHKLGRDGNGNLTLDGQRMQPDELMRTLLKPDVQDTWLDLGDGRTALPAGEFAESVRMGKLALIGGPGDAPLHPSWAMQATTRFWEAQPPKPGAAPKAQEAVAAAAPSEKPAPKV
jgi:hypothetical protein